MHICAVPPKGGKSDFHSRLQIDQLGYVSLSVLFQDKTLAKYCLHREITLLGPQDVLHSCGSDRFLFSISNFFNSYRHVTSSHRITVGVMSQYRVSFFSQARHRCFPHSQNRNPVIHHLETVSISSPSSMSHSLTFPV